MLGFFLVTLNSWKIEFYGFQRGNFMKNILKALFIKTNPNKCFYFQKFHLTLQCIKNISWILTGSKRLILRISVYFLLKKIPETF